MPRYGDVVIGGKDAKPDFTTWQWFSMSICGGIGCGLLFWAMGEPIYHYMDPPVAAGIEAETREAAIFAVSQAMFDWSFVQYFIYTDVYKRQHQRGHRHVLGAHCTVPV